MATRTVQNRVNTGTRTDHRPTSPEKVRERIEWYHGEGNCDALRHEAMALLSGNESLSQHLEKVRLHHEQLRVEVQAVTSHEHYTVVITDVDLSDKAAVEVAGLAPGRVWVSVHPDLSRDKLLIGATGLVARERNCLLRVTESAGRWHDVGVFEDYSGGDNRVLIRDRESLLAIDLAHTLRETRLTKGDLVGFDRDVARMAYERLPSPRSEHLFDEAVTDDFSQLGGLDSQIARIKRHIDFRVLHPALAAKYRLKSKCGLLLASPPGYGKTRIARCCAGYVRAQCPDRPCRFMHVAGSSDYNMWLGETERIIVQRFNAVRDAAKDGLVVMFWDEVDAIARRRGTDYGSGASDRILNTFLSQIDGVTPLSNVVIIYATNRPDTLDPGLLRAGRTDETIEIPPPNRRAAQSILRCYLEGGLPLQAGQASGLINQLLSHLFAPNGKYAEVARVRLSDNRRLAVAGRQLISGAMLENVVNSAAQDAAEREAQSGQPGVTEDDLLLALDAELTAAVARLAPGNVKNYVSAIPQEAQPIAVDALLNHSTAAFVRSRSN